MKKLSRKEKTVLLLSCTTPGVAIIIGAIIQGAAGFFLGCVMMTSLIVLLKMISGIKGLTSVYLQFMAVVWVFGWAFGNWTWRSLLTTAVCVTVVLILLTKAEAHQNQPKRSRDSSHW